MEKKTAAISVEEIDPEKELTRGGLAFEFEPAALPESQRASTDLPFVVEPAEPSATEPAPEIKQWPDQPLEIQLGTPPPVSTTPIDPSPENFLAPPLEPEGSSDLPVSEPHLDDMPAMDLTASQISTAPPIESTPSLESAQPDSVDPASAVSPPYPMPELPFTPEPVQMEPPPAVIPAAYPFDLKIEGFLRDNERARLLDLLSTYKIGIRELDLEPQFEAGRILLPRLGEYAAIKIALAMRDASVQIKIQESEPSATVAEPAQSTHESLDPLVTSREIPLTAGSHLPGISPAARPGDFVHASTAIRSSAVTVESSDEYLITIERLTRELKLKGRARGAIGLVGFKTQLLEIPGDPSHFRLNAYALTMYTATPSPALESTQVEDTAVTFESAEAIDRDEISGTKIEPVKT